MCRPMVGEEVLVSKPRLTTRTMVWNEAASRWLHVGETVCGCAGCGCLAVVILGPGAEIDGSELCDDCTAHYAAAARHAVLADFAIGPLYLLGELLRLVRRDDAGQAITRAL